MKPNLFVILLFILNSLFINTIIPDSETFEFSRGVGQLSEIINPQPQIGSKPSQYFLCGFAFREMKWTKLLQNCNCGYKLEDLKYVYKCEWCQNTMWTMSNGFRAIYCHSNNWKDQVTKTVETGNKESRNWRQHMCPINTYATRAAAKFGREFETGTGFVGMMLECSSLDLKQKTKIQDTYKHPLEEISIASNGTFISVFQIQFIKENKLTGIKIWFEYIAVIGEMTIKYRQIDGLKPSQRIIDSVFVVNIGKDTIQSQLILTKSTSYNNTWNTMMGYYGKYGIVNGVALKPLRLDSKDNSTGIMTAKPIYNQTTSDFVFDSYVTTTFTPSTKLVTSVLPRTILEAITTVQEMRMSLEYELNLTFCDRLSGKKISSQFLTGIWTGVATSQLKTTYNFIEINKITDPAVYNKYLSGGIYGSTEYRWTEWFGGWGASKTQTTEVPPGYWLVGMGARSGSNIDALHFQYTSNNKDLIRYGPLGSMGGGYNQFVADYLNGQWITKVSFWTISNLIQGMYVTTNKGRSSQLWGQGIGYFWQWDARWYKRWDVHHTNFVRNIRSEYMPNL